MTSLSRRTAPLAALVLVSLAACRAGGVPTTDVPTPTSSAAETPTPAVPSVPPSATESAEPTASDNPLAAFVMEQNPEADTLFLDRDSCTNVDDGYRVAFPDTWWTNTAIGEVGPCAWFAPTVFGVTDPSRMPAEIAILIEYIEGDAGSFEAVVRREVGLVGATQPAVRVEYRGAAGEGGQMPTEWRSYVYLVQLGPTEEGGPNLRITTDTDMAGDYELNKALLDRIVASMELIGSIQ